MINDLEEIKKHMSYRDHLPNHAHKDLWKSVYMTLADDVPGLVAEVERLRAEYTSYEVAGIDAVMEIERLRAMLDDVIGDLEEVAQKTDDYRTRDFARARAKDHRAALPSSEIQEGQ